MTRACGSSTGRGTVSGGTLTRTSSGGDGWAGGRIFDYGSDEVRNFLIQNAMMLLDEFHVDGFRYDEVSVIHNNNGSRFCRDLTNSLRYAKPGAIQIAEYWNWDRAKAVEPAPDGLGFDAALHDGLRGAIRAAIGAAAGGRSAYVDLDAVRDALRRPASFPASWKAVNHIENHDLVDGDRADPGETEPRIPALANWTDRRDWLARSRSRVATGLLLTAPGIPMLFMGQEFLEDKPWHNDPARTDLFLYWTGPRRGRRRCGTSCASPASCAGYGAAIRPCAAKGSSPISATTTIAFSPSSAGSRAWAATSSWSHR